MYRSGHFTVKLGTSNPQTFNQAIMVGQSSYGPKAGQLGGPAGPHGEEEKPRLKELRSEAKLRIDNLTSAVSTFKIKYATPDELRHYQQCTKHLIISWVYEMETAIEAYINEEDNEEKSEKVNDLMWDAWQEAVYWLGDLADCLAELDAPPDFFVELNPPLQLPVEPNPPPDLFEESKDSIGSLVELDAPRTFLVELDPPLRLPAELDAEPDFFEKPKDSADSLVELDAPPDFFVELNPP